VLEASDGIEGIAMARTQKPELSIVDIGLPGMDGYQIAANLRADPAMRGMRLIALTGYGQETDRRRALDAGFDDHFVKPLKFDELTRSLAST
jgi:CheY-like chemotaxis protein